MENYIIPFNSAPIIGVLSQIQKVNFMIEQHQKHEQSGMVKQFERQREGFLEQLRELLFEFKIHADLKLVAN